MSNNSFITLKVSNDSQTCYKCGHEFEKYQKIFSRKGGKFTKRYCIPCAKEVNLIIDSEIELLENRLRYNIFRRNYTQNTIELIKEVNHVQDL